jgi:hypothetical protein
VTSRGTDKGPSSCVAFEQHRLGSTDAETEICINTRSRKQDSACDKHRRIRLNKTSFNALDKLRLPAERGQTAIELMMEVDPKKQIANLLPRLTVFTVCEVSSDTDMAALYDTLRHLPRKPNGCYIIPIFELAGGHRGRERVKRNETAFELMMEIKPRKQIADLLPRVTVFSVSEVSSDEDMAALYETLKDLPCKANGCYIIPILELD